MAKWPFNFIVEIILCVSIFLAIITGLWIVVGWICSRHSANVLARNFCLLFSGMVIGVYVGLSSLYFSGYIADTYPKSQKIISDQEKLIKKLSDDILAVNSKLAIVDRQFADAKKALEDPTSVSKPSYGIDTSLRLQFDHDGVAREVEAHNLRWTAIDFKESEEHPGSSVPPDPIPNPLDSIMPNTLGLNLGLTTSIPPACARMTCPSAGPTYSVTLARMIILSFLRPIAASDVYFDAFGADLPNYSVIKLDERAAIIRFERAPKSVALKIDVRQLNN